MLIIGYQEWMTKTRLRFRRRSPLLKKLDVRIQLFESKEAKRQLSVNAINRKLLKLQRREDIRAIHHSLAEWMRSKDDYRSSGRNHLGAVSLLFEQVSAQVRFSLSEQQAMSAIKEARDGTLAVMLDGSELVMRNWLDSNSKRKVDVRRVTQFAPELMKLIYDIVKDAFGQSQESLQSSQLVYNLLKAATEELRNKIAEALPLVGTVVSLVCAIYSTGKAIQKTLQQDDIIAFGRKLPRGDAKEAVRACEKQLEREVNLHCSSALRSTANAGAGIANVLTAGAASGVSAATSIGTSIAVVLERIYQMGKDYLQVRRANKMLKDGEFSRDIFLVCPTLGAYYLAVAPISDIALFFVDIGSPAWMSEVEKLKKKKLDRIISIARRLVQDSRFQLVPSGGGSFSADVKPQWWRAFKDKKF